MIIDKHKKYTENNLKYKKLKSKVTLILHFAH
jgi:hypothetical protein